MHVQRVPYQSSVNTSTTTTKDVPPNAIGITAVHVNFNTAAQYPVSIGGQIVQQDLSGTLDFCRFLALRATKVARGYAPIVATVQGGSDQIQVSCGFVTAQSGSPAETGVVSITAEFLVLDAKDDPKTQFEPIPFKVDGAFPDQTFLLQQTSAATTAQQIDIKPLADIEYEVLSAWMVTNSPSTATATLSFWDGTTAVQIDTTAAVASYAANVAAKGKPTIINNGGSVVPMIRWAAGAAAAGTTTLYLAARARALN